MSSHSKPRSRQLVVKLHNLHNKIIHADRLELEKKLSLIADISINKIESLNDSELLPCDLLVINTHPLHGKELLQWLDKFFGDFTNQNRIWLPTLILGKVDFFEQNEYFLKIQNSNWYFDIIDPTHLSSIPVRAANLLRIHDHLHELNRYQTQVVALEKVMQDLQLEIKSLKT